MVKRLRASVTMHFKIPVVERQESLWNISILLLSLGRSLEVITAVSWVLGNLQRCRGLFDLVILRAFSLLWLLGLLVLSLKIVLGQVAVLTHATGVVGLVSMATNGSHLGLSLSMVAVVAHVLGVVLSVGMRALEDFSPLPLTLGLVNSFRSFRGFLEIMGIFAIYWGKVIDRFFDVKLNCLRRWRLLFGLVVNLSYLGQYLVHECIVQGLSWLRSLLFNCFNLNLIKNSGGKIFWLLLLLSLKAFYRTNIWIL